MLLFYVVVSGCNNDLLSLRKTDMTSMARYLMRWWRQLFEAKFILLRPMCSGSISCECIDCYTMTSVCSATMNVSSICQVIKLITVWAAEHVNGAGAAVLPLNVKSHFCDPRSRLIPAHVNSRSRSAVLYSRSPLCSRSPDFRPVLLRILHHVVGNLILFQMVQKLWKSVNIR